MSTLVNGTPTAANPPENAQEKPGFRTKTIATRITPEELREGEAAAEKSGKTLAVWLRELALNAARARPADPTELMLSEVMALRYVLLNLFHASESWPMPANCSPISWPGTMEPEGKSERRSDAFSQPGPMAPVANFALRSGAVSGSESRCFGGA